MQSLANVQKNQNLTRFTKVAPKGGNSTDQDYNLISSKGGQDTRACIISGHSLHAFFGKCRKLLRADGHAAKRSRLVGWTNGPFGSLKLPLVNQSRADKLMWVSRPLCSCSLWLFLHVNPDTLHVMMRLLPRVTLLKFDAIDVIFLILTMCSVYDLNRIQYFF